MKIFSHQRLVKNKLSGAEHPLLRSSLLCCFLRSQHLQRLRRPGLPLQPEAPETLSALSEIHGLQVHFAWKFFNIYIILTAHITACNSMNRMIISRNVIHVWSLLNMIVICQWSTKPILALHTCIFLHAEYTPRRRWCRDKRIKGALHHVSNHSSKYTDEVVTPPPAPGFVPVQDSEIPLQGI